MSENFFDKNYLYAIVGASQNPDKYGHKVLLDLHHAGYDVVAINPKETEIAGIPCFPTLQDVQKPIDVVVFVVRPMVTEHIVTFLPSLHITKVWMQPGAESQQAVAYCKQHNILCVHGACVMVEKP